ncbi:cysteine hydrolase family protein [Staphylococcus gallinarum]|uniref:cysteine hydrolase family protein n=1 Tax=Staphylococcus gallinarum TaxID=1293 RepID=UPI001E395162|nr:isochorismatase family cysteine hydrolase [Staphylococcus gallinarum]MCD8871057.1 cysteine hydrolase [Staphylococcus gallinarum]MCW0985686.1 cysteine hydrolase [Staphylococcus gallinarum]
MTKNSALIVMDMQNGIVNGIADNAGVIRANQQAIADARTQHIPVIFVRVAFTGDYLEVSENNKMFSQYKASGQSMSKEATSTQIIDDLHVEDTDPVVVKHRLSAFTGSNLEVLLRGMNINHIVLTGVSTSGVVLSTAVEAADKDFQITILADAVTDNDQYKHQFLVDNILTRYATINHTTEWLNK